MNAGLHVDFESCRLVGACFTYWRMKFLAGLDLPLPCHIWGIQQHDLYLTNRFHVAVRLFSNRSQMTSKCGKEQKSSTRGAAECVTDVLTTFWCPLWSISEQTHGNMESICFIYNKKIKIHGKNASCISNFATLTDTKIAQTWSNVYTKCSELIGRYA